MHRIKYVQVCTHHKCSLRGCNLPWRHEGPHRLDAQSGRTPITRTGRTCARAARAHRPRQLRKQSRRVSGRRRCADQPTCRSRRRSARYRIGKQATRRRSRANCTHDLGDERKRQLSLADAECDVDRSLAFGERIGAFHERCHPLTRQLDSHFGFADNLKGRVDILFQRAPV